MKFLGHSLRAKVVRTTTLVTAVAMIAMIATVMLVLNKTSDNAIDAALHDRLAAVSATLSAQPNGAVTEMETPDDTIDDSTWVFDTDGAVVSAPRAGTKVSAIAKSLSSTTHERSVERHDRQFLAAPVKDNTGKVFAVVVVSESLEPYEATQVAVLILLVSLGLVVTAGSAAIAAWTMRRALIPVEIMAASARDWSEHDLDARFDIADRQDEIGRLGVTLNLLLDRVAGALRSEQRLTAEVAHELRTPLTSIRGEAELAQMTSTDPATTERLAQIVELVDRMTTVITTLVEIARGDATAGTRAPSSAVIETVLAQNPGSPAIRFTVTNPDDPLVAAPADVAARALAPLVDNGVRFATSEVSIAVHSVGRLVEFHVTDDGPGIGDADLDSLFMAGTQTAQSSGAGLGLPLARRVAQTLGGDVRLSSSKRPTEFILTLPRF